MGKIKAKWQITDIPQYLKTKLLRIMKDNPNQTARVQAIARGDHEITDEERKESVCSSRDTFSKLHQELIKMPISEVNQLPEDLQPWVMDLRQQSTQTSPSTRTGEVIPSEASLIGQAKTQHWNDLSKLTEQIVSIWQKYLYAGTYIKAYITDVDSANFELLTIENGYLAQRLLIHLKAEFPDEFREITQWEDLLKDPLPEGCFSKLLLVSKRRTFKGTCDICQ